VTLLSLRNRKNDTKLTSQHFSILGPSQLRFLATSVEEWGLLVLFLGLVFFLFLPTPLLQECYFWHSIHNLEKTAFYNLLSLFWSYFNWRLPVQHYSVYCLAAFRIFGWFANDVARYRADYSNRARFLLLTLARDHSTAITKAFSGWGNWVASKKKSITFSYTSDANFSSLPASPYFFFKNQ